MKRDSVRRRFLSLVLLLLVSITWIGLSAIDSPVLGARGQGESGPRPLNFEALIKTVQNTEHQTVAETGKPATLSLSQLRRGQLGWRDKMESFHVKFEHSTKHSLAVPSDEARKKNGTYGDDALVTEFSYYKKGDNIFTEYRDKSVSPPHSTDQAASLLLKPHIRYAFDGTRTTNYSPVDTIAQIRPGKVDGFDSSAAFYLDFVSLPRYVPDMSYTDTTLYVPKALETGSYHLLPTLQQVDGNLCHVVTNFEDTIWIDHEHGFTVPRRLRLYDTAAQNRYYLGGLYIAKNFKDCFQGVRMPQLCYYVDYPKGQDPENSRNKAAKVDVIKVLDIGVNDVNDSQFQLEIPPGSKVQDLVKNLAYTMPEGQDLMDKALADAKVLVDGRVQPTASQPSMRALRLTVLLSLPLVAFAFVLIRVFSRSRLSKPA
jgi:hypothetical protein